MGVAAPVKRGQENYAGQAAFPGNPFLAAEPSLLQQLRYAADAQVGAGGIGVWCAEI